MIGFGIGVNSIIGRGLNHARTILTITNNGSNFARVTTAAAHGRSNGQLVFLIGNSVAGYNNNESTVTVISATVFDLDLAYISDGTGGSWALA